MSEGRGAPVTWSGFQPGDTLTFIDSGVFPALVEDLGDGTFYVRVHAFGGWLHVTPDGHVRPEPVRYASRPEAEDAVRARLRFVERLRSEGTFVQQ